MRLSLLPVLEHRYLPAFLIGAGLFLTLPSLFSGLQLDDYLHREMLSGRSPWTVNDASLFGLFSFLDGDPARMAEMRERGFAQWWAYDGVRAAFWRPLTEVTHWLDYRLWPHSPLLMHLQNALWFGAVIWIVAALYRRIIRTGRVAGLAALLFAIDNAHGGAVGWIANRNALVAACFGGLALLTHDHWRRDGWTIGAFVAPCCFGVGMLAGETTLAAGAYLLAYMFCLEQGRLRRRIAEFLPYVAIVAIWSAAYRALGFGTQYTGMYIDPGQQTGLFIRALFERAPLLLLGQFAEPPAELYALFGQTGRGLMWMMAVSVVGLVGVALFPLLRRDKVARFWAFGMILSLVPVCATFPHNRLLLFPGIGAIGLVAQFLSERYGFKLMPCPSQEAGQLHSRSSFVVSPSNHERAALRQSQGEWRSQIDMIECNNSAFEKGMTIGPSRQGGSVNSHPGRGQGWGTETRKQQFWQRIATSVAMLFTVTHLILAPLTLPVASLDFALYEELLVKRDALRFPFDRTINGKTVIFINPPIAFFSMYGSFIREARGLPVPACIYTLASGLPGATITRVDAQTFDMEIPGGWWQIELDRIFRGADAPMQVGVQGTLQRMTAEVLALTSDEQPSRVRFRFNAPLEDEALVYIVWRPGQPPGIYHPPAIGASETLERLPLPLL